MSARGKEAFPDQQIKALHVSAGRCGRVWQTRPKTGNHLRAPKLLAVLPRERPIIENHKERKKKAPEAPLRASPRKTVPLASPVVRSDNGKAGQR